MTLVTGTWLKPDLRPDAGYVRFTLVPAARDSDGNQITCTSVFGVLDQDGRMSIDLVPDPALVVDGTAVYEVHENIGDCERKWLLVLDGGTDPVDLPSRWPGDTVSGAAVLPVPGPAGETGEGAQWATVPTQADLPPAGYLGQRIRVAAGLGLQVMVWTGTGWAVAPESDTGECTVGALLNGWTAAHYRLRRRGDIVTHAFQALSGAAATNRAFYDFAGAPGFRPERRTNYATWLVVGTVPLRWEADNRVFADGTFASAVINGYYPVPTTQAWPTTAPV